MKLLSILSYSENQLDVKIKTEPEEFTSETENKDEVLIKKELKDKIENKDQEFIYDDGDENKENIDPDAGIYREVSGEVSGKLITKLIILILMLYSIKFIFLF